MAYISSLTFETYVHQKYKYDKHCNCDLDSSAFLIMPELVSAIVIRFAWQGSLA